MMEHFCINPGDCFACRINKEEEVKHPKVRKIRFVAADLRFFDVLNENSDIVYHGCIEGREPSLGDCCDCMGWTIKNTKEFEEKNKHTFQCFHIKLARKTRFEGYP